MKKKLLMRLLMEMLVLTVAMNLAGCGQKMMPNHKYIIWQDEPEWKKEILRSCVAECNAVREKRGMAQISIVEKGNAGEPNLSGVTGALAAGLTGTMLTFVPLSGVVLGPAAKEYDHDKRVFKKEVDDCLRRKGL